MCGVTFCSLNTQAGSELFLRPWLPDFRELLRFRSADCLFMVLLPELVVRHWWENALHNQRVQLLKLLLLLRGNQRIVVVNIPWYL